MLLHGSDSTLHKHLRLAINNLPSRSERSVSHAQAEIILAVLEWERGRNHNARLYLGAFLKPDMPIRPAIHTHADSGFNMIIEIQNTRLDQLSDDELIVNRIALRAASIIGRCVFESDLLTPVILTFSLWKSLGPV